MDEIDENGYKRNKDGKLTSRSVAYNKIYRKNRDKYPLPFSSYEVHHRSRNKLNNRADNLDIVTREEHERIHSLGLKGKKELEEYNSGGYESYSGGGYEETYRPHTQEGFEKHVNPPYTPVKSPQSRNRFHRVFERLMRLTCVFISIGYFFIVYLFTGLRIFYGIDISTIDLGNAGFLFWLQAIFLILMFPFVFYFAVSVLIRLLDLFD